MYINGNWESAISGKTFDSINPASGKYIAEVPDGDDRDTTRSIDAADSAFKAWSKSTAYQRSVYLNRIYQLMCENREKLAHTMTEEQGKPLKAARNEVQYAADFMLWYSEEVKRVYGRTIPAPRADQRFILNYSPVGVVAAITPWNYPISMITRKVAPALAAGCTVVLKPAEATPLCAVETFKLFEQAELPPGVVNLVTAKHPGPVGETFLEDKRIRKLTFTGSTDVGKMLAQQAAIQMKRTSFELGGHAPFIVCKDADPVKAAKGVVLVKFLNTGQACISPNRLYVHKDQMDAFVNEFAVRVEGMKAGSGFEEGVSIGPLVNENALLKVERQVADALDNGAELVTGGKRLVDDGLEHGHFFAPTILKGVTPDMLIYREETFGPVAPIIEYEDDDDLLEMANDTHYGLAAYIYTDKMTRAMTLFEGLNFGIIGINDINPTAVAAPFGGMKESGLGREGGPEGILEYLDIKVGGFSLR
ncbi:MAG: NAD-dependent succinate-semialdehyde dehydrogenase [Proteobacteria bacterium]|nr:NAD-dependent succinate-semialdehyde dehydrogenase [Pseudomonadota bacterium]